MTLSELLTGVEVIGALPEREITALTCDSRQAEEGSVFFCIQGLNFDGHDYAEMAVKNGASAIICQRELGLENQILVSDTRQALGICSSNFFGNPACRLKLIGVTGTNGKTTVTYLIKHILEQAGKRVGLIGTIHNEIDDVTLPTKYTTPDPIQLHAMFARMVEAGCEYAVMEVSSHALEQERVAGCRFAVAAFTNLTQDHLDFHGTMENYFSAKKKLFDICGTAAINCDDEYGRRLLGGISCPALSFSCKGPWADYTAHDIKFTEKGSHFIMMANGELIKMSLKTPGYFSVSNAMAAAVSCVAAGIEVSAVAKGLATCPGVPGRVEIISTDTPYTVIRDYAHSPDSLQKILETVRQFAPGRVVTLFGAAGNRDRKKRPLMGAIAAKLSDFCVLTSDNPRDEDPRRIIDDVAAGFAGYTTPHMIIADRYDAIRWALENARPGDTLLLAGKGHEDYQVLDFGTIYFDEKAIVLDLLGKMRQEGYNL